MVATSPQGNRPVEQDTKLREAEQQGQEKAILTDQAAFMGVTETQAFAKLEKMIQNQLVKRVGELMANDPQAQGLVRLIKEYCGKEFAAREAVAELSRRFRKED